MTKLISVLSVAFILICSFALPAFAENIGDNEIEYYEGLDDYEEFEQDYSEFRLNYVNEAVYGDTISIYKEYTECGIILIGKVDEKVCFEAEFKRTGINML